MKEKIRIALIGVGVMGSKYAKMITEGETPHLILTAVVARRKELQDWAKGLANTDGTSPCVFASSDELFEQPELYDALLIVTPHKTHPELAKRAFALGKHVMCDKPAGITFSQARNMAAQADAAGTIYGVMFHQRMYPKYIKIRELLAGGELGTLSRIMLVNSRYFRTHSYHRSGSWRSSWQGEGGGVLINQGAHILDIWQWLFGLPETIYADIPFGKYNHFLVDDEATIQMRYPNNVTAVFMITTGEAVWEERLEIIGSKGKLLLENDTLHIWRYSSDSREYMASQQVTSRENMEMLEELISFEKAIEPYPRMLENFGEAILQNDPTILTAPGSEAAGQLILTNAAYYSAFKKMPVSLPLDGAAYDAALKEHCDMEGKK